MWNPATVLTQFSDTLSTRRRTNVTWQWHMCTERGRLSAVQEDTSARLATGNTSRSMMWITWRCHAIILCYQTFAVSAADVNVTRQPYDASVVVSDCGLQYAHSTNYVSPNAPSLFLNSSYIKTLGYRRETARRAVPVEILSTALQLYNYIRKGLPLTIDEWSSRSLKVIGYGAIW